MRTQVYNTNIENKAQQLQVENQQLRSEVKTYKLIESEYNKLRTFIAKAAHDLSSPLATMLMVIPQCDTLSEKVHHILKQSATNINNIAKDILCQFEAKSNKIIHSSERPCQQVLISTEILSILTNKQYEYGGLPINFASNISADSNFAFANINALAFSRAVSNLINNAVDALDGRKGTITVSVKATKKRINIAVIDNGKGIPEVVIYKIMHGIRVSANKANGHGIGFEQVRDMLKFNAGKMSINSTVGIGTIVKLSFPRLNTKVV